MRYVPPVQPLHAAALTLQPALPAHSERHVQVPSLDCSAPKRRRAPDAELGYKERWAAKKPRPACKGRMIEICSACELAPGPEGASCPLR